MEALKKLFATFVAGIMSLPYLLFAQDDGTYIDNLGVQDSSYMEQDMLAEGAQEPSSGTIVIIVVVVLIVIAAIVYFIKKRKK